MQDHGVKGFWVGDWLVEPALSRVKRGQDTVHIEPRSMAVLECLVAHPGEVLSKDRLIKSVWGDAFVGDEVLTHAIWELRKGFGDNARNPTYIQTIPKRGYRLVAAVRPLVRARGWPRPSKPPRLWAALGIAAAALILVLAWLAREPRALEPFEIETAEASTQKPRRARLQITLRDPSDPESQRLLDIVSPELAGRVEFDLVYSDDTGPFGPRDYRLELFPPIPEEGMVGFALSTLEGGAQEVSGGKAAYLPEVEAAYDLYARMEVLGEINVNDLYHDEHIKPWIHLDRHDWRAIHFFLRGARLTLNGEPGYTPAYLAAADLDSDFLAPLVWSPGTCRGDGDERLGACVDRLKKIERDIDEFESVVARFMLHRLAMELPEALRSLELALKEAPYNGPLLVNRAGLEDAVGRTESALQTLRLLLETRWQYPAVYPQAASYALKLQRFDEARLILEVGQAVRPEVIDTLVLLEALALLEGESEAAAGYGRRFEDRLEQLPEGERGLRVRQGYALIIDHARASRDAEVVAGLEARLQEVTRKTS